MNTSKTYTLIAIVVLAIFTLPACKSSKRVGKSVVLKERSSKYLLKKLAANRIEAEWLSAKARINYSDDSESVKFNANFRYRKDSLIWLNVKKTTVEAFRIQITPDSFYFINRLDNEYFINSIEAIEERFNLPQRTASDLSTFDLLQEILLGNPVFFAGSDLESSVDDQEYVLRGQSEHFNSEYRLNGVDFLINVMNFLPDDERQFLKAKMERADKEEDYPNFSYFRTYRMNAPQRGDVKIKIKFSKLELNSPNNIRFEIPSNYKRIE